MLGKFWWGRLVESNYTILRIHHSKIIFPVSKYNATQRYKIWTTTIAYCVFASFVWFPIVVQTSICHIFVALDHCSTSFYLRPVKANWRGYLCSLTLFDIYFSLMYKFCNVQYLYIFIQRYTALCCSGPLSPLSHFLSLLCLFANTNSL